MRGSSRSVFLVGLILESSSGHGIERPRRGIAGGGIVYCEFFTDVFKSFGECVGSIDVGCHRVFCSGLRNNALSDAAEETADRRTGRMILVDRHILHLAAGDGHAAVAAIVIVGPISFCVIRRVERIRLADETANQELRPAAVILIGDIDGQILHVAVSQGHATLGIADKSADALRRQQVGGDISIPFLAQQV